MIKNRKMGHLIFLINLPKGQVHPGARVFEVLRWRGIVLPTKVAITSPCPTVGISAHGFKVRNGERGSVHGMLGVLPKEIRT
jgi:hypothetical protein